MREAHLFERDAELGLLSRRIESLRGARASGHCVVVEGEAGLGKTSLLAALRRATGPDVEWLCGGCEPLLAAPPLGALIDLIDSLPPSLAAAVRRGGPLTQEVLAGMLTLLRDRARPLVLAIDDVQWADGASLDLLRYLARRVEGTRTLLLMLCRTDPGGDRGDGNAVRAMLAGLPASALTRLVLAPLSREAVASLAAQAGRSGEGLFEATRGNPFFVTEVLAAPPGALPRAVRDAVLLHAAGLAPWARDALDLVSLCPGGLEVEVLDAVLDDVGRAVDACLHAGLLQQQAQWLVFRHELARQAIEDACAPLRAADLHHALFDALSLRGASTQRLVHHAAKAGLGAAVLRLAPAAAREAADFGAHRQAAALYTLALEHAGSLDAAHRASLLVRSADTHAAWGRLREASALRKQALALHRVQANLLAAGIDLCELSRLDWFAGAVAQGVGHARAAIETLTQAQAPTAAFAQAHALLAQLHLIDDPDAALHWGEKALQEARACGDLKAEIAALNAVGFVQVLRDDAADGWNKLEQALALAREHDEVTVAARTYGNLASLMLVQRRFDGLRALCDEALACTEAHDLDRSTAVLRIRLAAADIEQGQWARARAELLRLRERLDLPPLQDEQSRFLLAKLDLREGRPALPGDWAVGFEGRLWLSVDPWYAPQAPAVVEAAWTLGEGALAGRLAQGFLPLALARGERWRIGQLLCWMRRLGLPLPASLPDRLPSPCQHELESRPQAAARAWQALGCAYEAALALLHGDPQDGRAALKQFDALGAVPAARLARRRLRAAGIADVARGPYRGTRDDPAGLTPRERQVLELLREGLTNAQIAQRLHRSPRTVEHHVAGLLAKLGVATREAAMAAAQARERAKTA
jgi:DNA-binding CsgD family transcriptional regulator